MFSWRTLILLSVLLILFSILVSCASLHRAAENGNTGRINDLLAQGVDVNLRDPNGTTALMYAAKGSEKAVIQILIDKGADVNAKSKNGRTALMYAAMESLPAAVQLLMDKGADLNAKDNQGRTALMYAAKEGQKAVFQILIDKGADVNAKNKEGRTALMYAAMESLPDAVQLLMDKGADLNAKDNQGKTALDLAGATSFWRSSAKIVELLKAHEAKLAQTPLPTIAKVAEKTPTVDSLPTAKASGESPPVAPPADTKVSKESPTAASPPTAKISQEPPPATPLKPPETASNKTLPEPAVPPPVKKPETVISKPPPDTIKKPSPEASVHPPESSDKSSKEEKFLPAPRISMKYFAVVIGITNFKNPKVPSLRYTKNDALAIYDWLISPQGGGYSEKDVELLIDQQANLMNIRTALGTWLPRRALRNDTVFIFYAGHGAPEPDAKSDDGYTKYLVPYDADPDNLYATALPMKEMADIFDRIEAERIIFVADACYSGASGGRTLFRPGSRALSISSQFLDQLSQAKGRVVITASDINEVSGEIDDLKHGIFTYYLLEALSGKADTNNDGIVDLREAYEYLYEKVARHSKLAGYSQHPVWKGDTRGRVLLGTTK